ncbi:zinc finger, CCHC-type containing protein [Tanacetum coccineum]
MTSSMTRLDIKKFDGKNGFGLWQIKMLALMVQQGCDTALKTLSADMKAGEKVALMKKAYNTLILCLRDRVLREVTKETAATRIWTKLTFLYMIKSLANRLYLKKKLYTYYMSPETLLYERESLTMEDVLATLNSRELKKRTKSTKEDTGDRLYVRGRSDHSGKDHLGGSLQFKSRGETGKLKCFICHSKGHMKRDCPLKKSSWFVRKGKHDQYSDSSDDEGGSYHMTHRRDFLYDFKVVDGGLVQLGDNKTCTIKGTVKLKIQLHDRSSFMQEDVRIKVIKGCRVMITGIKKKNCVYTFKAKVMNLGVQEHGGSKQVGLKQLGSKQVGFKQLELQEAQWDHKAEVFQVSNDDVTVAQRRLKDKQLEEKTNTACLVKEQEKVHLEDADADEDVSRKRKRDLNVKMNSLRYTET